MYNLHNFVNKIVSTHKDLSCYLTDESRISIILPKENLHLIDDLEVKRKLSHFFTHMTDNDVNPNIVIKKSPGSNMYTITVETYTDDELQIISQSSSDYQSVQCYVNSFINDCVIVYNGPDF